MSTKKPTKEPPEIPVPRPLPALKGKPGWWAVIDRKSGKVVGQAKTLAKAVKLAKKRKVQQPSYDVIPPTAELILPTIPLLGAS